MKHSFQYLTVLLFLSACSSTPEFNHKRSVATDQSLDIQFTEIKRAGSGSDIKLPAQFSAYQEVSIFPKVNAYVKTVGVDIGDKVTAGQVLMTLEAPELEQATIQAKEKYSRALADYSIDREHYQRLLEAAKTPGAISALDLSIMRAKMDADSALSNAEKSNWDMQKEMQTYLVVRAPFNGVITERNVFPGALVSAVSKDKPMLELKEISRLRLQVEIPEAIASSLRVKDSVAFSTSSNPGKLMNATISRKSMNVNPKFRSEKIEIDVDNHDRILSPGMYADVIVHSNGNANAFVVPESGVITSTERKFVWVLNNKKLAKVDVTTGSSSNGKVEIFGNLHEGEKVVSNPSDDLADGQPIL